MIRRALLPSLAALALAACAVPAMASNPASSTFDPMAQSTVAVQAPLEAVAPVNLASPDNAPLAAQIAAPVAPEPSDGTAP